MTRQNPSDRTREADGSRGDGEERGYPAGVWHGARRELPEPAGPERADDADLSPASFGESKLVCPTWTNKFAEYKIFPF